MKNANLKYVILSGDNNIGLIWESNGQEVIVFDKEVKIDLNFGFEIRDVETGEVVAEKMWLDVITGELQKGKLKQEGEQPSVDEFKHAWDSLNTDAPEIVINLNVSNKEDLNTFASKIIKNLKKQKGLR
jgi:hypothetical protein